MASQRELDGTLEIVTKLIQVGTDEILLDDAVRCADKPREAGVDVTLEIWSAVA